MSWWSFCSQPAQAEQSPLLSYQPLLSALRSLIPIQEDADLRGAAPVFPGEPRPPPTSRRQQEVFAWSCAAQNDSLSWEGRARMDTISQTHNWGLLQPNSSFTLSSSIASYRACRARCEALGARAAWLLGGDLELPNPIWDSRLPFQNPQKDTFLNCCFSQNPRGCYPLLVSTSLLSATNRGFFIHSTHS